MLRNTEVCHQFLALKAGLTNWPNCKYLKYALVGGQQKRHSVHNRTHKPFEERAGSLRSTKRRTFARLHPTHRRLAKMSLPCAFFSHQET